ncbi:MAG: cytochrome C oxidase subunit I, partial [Xanthomonadales bacterium]|nr:cytochrome C oxidase subunit I [Xanthomonadales bacterium]
MSSSRYDFPISSETVRRTTTAWLMLALVSLVGAGLFSLLLVLSRTPVVQEVLPLIDFFRIALVVHVDLSVLIWLLSMAGVLWALSTDRDLPGWDRISFWLAASGTAVVIISPFIGAGDPLMNNYVPVLRHPVFYTGLGLFTAGVLSHLLRSAITFTGLTTHLDGAGALQVGTKLAAVTAAVAIGAFITSFFAIPADMQGQAYFEFLFWGGGHVLQFTHTLLMMVVWVLLASNSSCKISLTPRLMLTYFLLMTLPVITVPFLYLAHDVVSPGHRLAFTELMKYGGLSSIPLGLAILVSIW